MWCHSLHHQALTEECREEPCRNIGIYIWVVCPVQSVGSCFQLWGWKWEKTTADIFLSPFCLFSATCVSSFLFYFISIYLTPSWQQRCFLTFFLSSIMWFCHHFIICGDAFRLRWFGFVSLCWLDRLYRAYLSTHTLKCLRLASGEHALNSLPHTFARPAIVFASNLISVF